MWDRRVQRLFFVLEASTFLDFSQQTIKNFTKLREGLTKEGTPCPRAPERAAASGGSSDKMRSEVIGVLAAYTSSWWVCLPCSRHLSHPSHPPLTSAPSFLSLLTWKQLPRNLPGLQCQRVLRPPASWYEQLWDSEHIDSHCGSITFKPVEEFLFNNPVILTVLFP